MPELCEFPYTSFGLVNDTFAEQLLVTLRAENVSSAAYVSAAAFVAHVCDEQTHADLIGAFYVFTSLLNFALSVLGIWLAISWFAQENFRDGLSILHNSHNSFFLLSILFFIALGFESPNIASQKYGLRTFTELSDITGSVFLAIAGYVPATPLALARACQGRRIN